MAGKKYPQTTNYLRCEIGWKTTVARQFSAVFQSFIYLNLELPSNQKPFKDFSNFETLLRALFFLKNKSLAKRANTLVLIDEIQEVLEALSVLKVFL